MSQDTHPSFGIINLSRRNGTKGPMFGSAIDTHVSTICLEIYRAQRIHHLNYDSYHQKELLSSVEMTTSQFSDLITSMNHGSGIPCTLKWVSPDGRIAPAPVEMLRTESHKIISDYVDGIKDPNEQVLRFVSEAIEIVANSKLGKKDKEAILRLLQGTKSALAANQKFIVDQIKEAAEKTMSAAKTEVDSFITAVLSNTGLTALKDGLTHLKQIAQEK